MGMNFSSTYLTIRILQFLIFLTTPAIKTIYEELGKGNDHLQKQIKLKNRVDQRTLFFHLLMRENHSPLQKKVSLATKAN